MLSEQTDQLRTAFFSAIEGKVSEQAFETWFRPLKVTRTGRDKTLKILVPNAVARDWILANYSNTVEQSLRESDLGVEHIEWSLPTQPRTAAPDQSKPLDVATLAASSDPRLPLAGIAGGVITAPLNENYTFGGFVVASCNRFAHAAAQAVAESPGRTYNPLYLYGGVGLGKTHLLQAVGHSIKAANPNYCVAYLSLERFMNELINAIRYGYDKTQLFREKYRSIDVLLIDDVQFIAGKERTQEEFFHTFNALYDAQKQIVLTSDCPPREIPEIEERLHSRFEWGLIADLEPPDLETKVAILKRKAEIQRINLPDDVALFVAGQCKHNVRELEGHLIRVIAMASLRGLPITKSLAQEALRHVARPSYDNALSVPRIQKAVADHYKISVETLKARSNSRSVLVPRQVAMYLCKRLTTASFPEIARHFGGKHHTTVMHSVEKIDGLLGKDTELGATIKRLIESVSD